MELRVLRYFLMVAREENITRAADFLHITQPTLSRQLADLESELGVTLFERSSHRIRLTQDGLLLKRSAQEIVELEEKTRNQFLNNDETISGELSFGCGELSSMTELSAALSQFHAEHPMVHYTIFSGTADDIKDRVEKGLLDFALLLEPVDISTYEFIRMKTKEKWCALVKADSELAQKKELAPNDLKDMTLILPSRGMVKNVVSNWLGDYAKNITIAATANLPYNGAVAVKQGLGVSLTLSLECRYDGVAAIPLTPAIECGSVLAWKRGLPHSRAVERFIQTIK
ncbi:MAG: LysR family transcriptional regulator [Treponema sp.]|nr:LysR family transcriptional regulator [Treponema sp.]